jgi:hypothetical protein
VLIDKKLDGISARFEHYPQKSFKHFALKTEISSFKFQVYSIDKKMHEYILFMEASGLFYSGVQYLGYIVGNARYVCTATEHFQHLL